MQKKLKGIGASKGIAIAKAYKLINPVFNITKRKIESKTNEITKVENAFKTSLVQLEKIKTLAHDKLGEEKAMIFQAHMEIVKDPAMKSEIQALINKDSVNADFAVQTIYNKYYNMFIAMKDSYFQERSADVTDVKKRILANLLGLKLPNILGIDHDVIIVAEDLTPSETAQLNKKYVKGFVTDIGGKTSHSAIMAQTLEIPAVLSLKTITTTVNDGDTIALDGFSGEVIINPSSDNVKDFKNRAIQFIKNEEELKKYIGKESITKDGHKVLIEANIGNSKDMEAVLKYKAEGVGLFRTEFLYMDANDWPTEDEQFNSYKQVLEKSLPYKVVIRTLDIGGDKKLTYYTFPKEMNPFLGIRAIRFCLANKDIFRVQLRALGRASVYGKLAIMFPMIATIDEFREAKTFTLEVFDELAKEGISVSKDIEIGLMCEISSTAILADRIAMEADFMSIGTNDLIQYTFAVDRMSKEINYLYQPNNPSLLRAINMAIKGCHVNKKWIGMCGEMAGDALSIPLLLGLGLDCFSMSVSKTTKAKQLINNLNFKDCEKLANEVITKCSSKSDVETLTKAFLVKNKLL